MEQLPSTLGELKQSEWRRRCAPDRSVKDELRENLIVKIRAGEKLFPGVVGYEDTVVPQVVNAILARHNFILLGTRGQAKTRLIRMLTTLLDEWMPYLAGSEIRDHPLAPLSQHGKEQVAALGDATPIAWIHREERYVEKLATPDVTIADMIGDIDPIKAARLGRDISSESTVHYGLLPRANRGIFAINELPDLAGKIQVGLFNIMQEGDIQIKGYPVRLPLDVVLLFTANPDDYTARGKIITPLKDRIGSEIRTHYPHSIELGMEITTQEAWTRRSGGIALTVPKFIRETVEAIAFIARDDKRIDKRSGVSQRLPISVMESVVSNAERRALLSMEVEAVPRVVDLYAALPSMTGKMELEYEGELKGGEAVARELIKAAVGRVFTHYFDGANLGMIVKYFERGGALKLEEGTGAADMILQLMAVEGLFEKTAALGIGVGESDAMRAAAAEFILEGLYAHRRISRSEELGFMGEERRAGRGEAEENPPPRNKKRQQFN
ncbi:MAG: magnesium chelatase [Acidobacteriota bacterium]|jgi:magnesium chelatase subunit I|nr:magnesium chelatase [Bryobacteraceae bacterium CoA2 C42]MCA2966340.1 magnesium chelatase [Acidobacteriaceae bacterium]